MLNLPRLAGFLRNGAMQVAEYLAELKMRFAKREPEVLAFVPEPGRWERLAADAAVLYAHWPEPAGRPALFGVPVAVKDIFHVDGLPTRAGSQLPPEVLAGRQAEAVTRLKAAGALIFGKSVTTEFAYFAPGPTRNPHAPAHTPGGSSSGSAAAVGAGLVPLALGTQTIGSIIRPASFCGVVGYKPSYERVSRAGVIPLSPALDHIGPFAADVAGVDLVARVLWADGPEAGMPANASVQRPSLGVPTGPYLAQAGPVMATHFEAVLDRLAEAGYAIRRIPVMPDFAEIADRHQAIVAAEAAREHATWYAEFGARYHPKTRELIERGRAVSDDALASMVADRARLRTELEQLRLTHAIDLWIAPSAPGPAPHGLESTGDPIMNLPWSFAGLPALNLPTGYTESSLALGTQLIGGWWQDEALLAWAQRIEETLGRG
jgi:Asp-tRNA(Asn)/Glu-tRNA(Gln) amidotransferase A subunit family amidase